MLNLVTDQFYTIYTHNYIFVITKVDGSYKYFVRMGYWVDINMIFLIITS